MTRPLSRSGSFALTPTAAGRLACALVLAGGLSTCPLTPEALELACIVAVAAALATSATRRLLHTLPAALGVVALGVAPLALTVGVERAALALIRGVATVTCIVAIAGAIPLAALPGALGGLGLPRAVATVLTSALRHTVVLRNEATRLLLARRLRGAATYRGTGALLGTLLSRALLRAERVELSMELRGYTPEQALRRTRPALSDVPVLLLCAVAGASVHFVGRIHV